METPNNSIVALFNQLGLDSTKEGISTFISNNAPLQSNIELHKASFWNESQQNF